MGDLCGCNQYRKQGKKEVLKRAAEIVNELCLTSQNADDYEATEIIAGIIAPFGSKDDDAYRTAAWVSNLHMDMSRLDREKRYQSHVEALRDIFSRLPARGEPKQIATTYHQLEQLCRELDEADLASLEPQTQEAIRAVNHVHDGLEVKVARLKQRYGL